MVKSSHEWPVYAAIERTRGGLRSTARSSRARSPAELSMPRVATIASGSATSARMPSPMAAPRQPNGVSSKPVAKIETELPR